MISVQTVDVNAVPALVVVCRHPRFDYRPAAGRFRAISRATAGLDKASRRMHCAVMPLDGWWLRAAAVLERLGFVRAAVLFGCVLVVVSEGLGAIDAFARGPVVLTWVVVAVAGAATLAWACRRGAADPGAGPPGLRLHLRRDGLETIALWPRRRRPRPLLLTALLFTTQQRRCAGLPSAPGPALASRTRASRITRPTAFTRSRCRSWRVSVAHLQLLSGGDRFASVPQWAAFLGCIIVAASLARRLFGGCAAVLRPSPARRCRWPSFRRATRSPIS